MYKLLHVDQNCLIAGVASVSEVPFELSVAGGPAVIGFPAVDSVLAVASIPADPGVPIQWVVLHTGMYSTIRYITKRSN